MSSTFIALLCGALLFTSVSTFSSSDSVNVHKYNLDAEIRDIMWCGSNNEAILILTEKGSVYRSRDRGDSWTKL